MTRAYQVPYQDLVRVKTLGGVAFDPLTNPDLIKKVKEVEVAWGVNGTTR